MVLSGTTFDEVTVRVDGRGYSVSAEADDEGMVTASVTALADPDAEVDAVTQAKAMYAAGVQTQLFEGIFERPATLRPFSHRHARSFQLAQPRVGHAACVLRRPV